MGLLTGKADDRQQYIDIWRRHIYDLHILFRAAGTDIHHAENCIDELMSTLFEAADASFPEES